MFGSRLNRKNDSDILLTQPYFLQKLKMQNLASIFDLSTL